MNFWIFSGILTVIIHLHLFFFSLSNCIQVRHGQCAVSAYGFQVFAALCCAIGKQSECCRYAHLGLKVLERYQIQEWTPRVFTMAYGVNLFLTQPLETLSDPLIHAHQVGLGTGDFEFAMVAAYIHSLLTFFLGKPLLKVEKVISHYLLLMTEYKQDQYFNVTTPMLQAVENLAGRSKDPIVLTGNVMNQGAALQIINESKDQSFEVIFSFWRLYLAYMFHNYELASEMAITSRPTAFIYGLHQCLFDGLTAVAIGQTSKRWEKRKCIKSAEKSLKKAKKVTQSQHTAMNKIFLLKAEIALLKSGMDSALPLYELSIELAKSSGFVHEEALANERAGLALLHLNTEDSFGFSFLQNAIKLYEDWGAHAKVAHLAKLFPKLAS
uniref:Anaphase-promoting complex subunit 5 n=1 Tax=Asterionellopsis glacialis TaxID=33640 RepID=A0A7S0KXE6_9STRA|mmetsp:Transcript_1665/g.2364  ORF Transcript_1665/g.2364 Transcript_1665/m.2364 type:complete len:382 (+) Transcript_1665:769-1914(+)